MEKGKIEIVGLGAGALEQLPLGIYRKLKKEAKLFLRTKEHPVVKELVQEGITFHSFDSIYEGHEDFSIVYQEISETLLNEAINQTIVYAVPGHPIVAEKTVQLLLEKGTARGITIEIIGGQSFIDPLLQAVRVDPIEGFQLLDGTSLHRDQLQIEQHIIIAQVYDTFVASEVKLTLMEKLPDDYELFVVTAAGTIEEEIRKTPLYMLDREMKLNNLTSIYVPPVGEADILLREFSSFREIVATLRGPGGCPWDQRQTHETLRKNLIEETYEVCEAIENDDLDGLAEELGDVLLQVVLHAQIGEEAGYFQIEDVIEGISAKMIRRHPHVFSDVTVENEEEVRKNWEQIKAQEREGIEKQAILAGVNRSAPHLLQALEIQKKAATVGFDWGEIGPALEKVIEEWEELKEEILKEGTVNNENIQKEFGDILFALVNVARFLKINPEEALFQTNVKFMNRFAYIEEEVEKRQQAFADFTLAQLDIFWEEAKKKGL